MFVYAWHGEQAGGDLLMLRCLRRVFDEGEGVVADQADPDMKALHRLALRVSHERERMKQFVRLQKAADGTYFAAVTPEHDALPLALDYFTDRFADQRWLIYDRKRDYGYYYDGASARRVTLEDDRGMIADKLADEWLAEDEREFQLLWKNYFRALAIPALVEELFPGAGHSPADERTLAAPHDAAPLLETPDRNGVNAGREVNSAACPGD